VACSPERLNQTIYIEGIGERVCDDTGSAITKGRVDVYVEDHQAALRLGVKKARVYKLNFRRLDNRRRK
jgi:3D (Asp-Asp-Asp) domain-containing protein